MTILGVIRRSTSTLADPTDKLDGLGLDSLEFVELIKDLEAEFSIRVPDSEIANLHTVEDLIALVHRLQNENIVCG